jgi:TolB protein
MIAGRTLLQTPVFANPDGWRTYSDRIDRVTVRFPSDWKTNPAYSDRTYFEGASGFFQLIPSAGNTPEQVCQGAATHHLQPFGSNPQVRTITLQGKKACLVWPSADQGAPHNAEVVLQYPKPLVIDGQAYGQLMVDADKKHLLAIAQSIGFLP